MKSRAIYTLIILVISSSCGSKKAAVNREEFTKEVNSYVSKVDANNNLEKEVTEGALTDAEGFKDIGTFKYTVYFDEKTNELYKIINIERTTDTVDETYYFKDGKFVFVKFKGAKNGDRKLYNVTSKREKIGHLDFYKDKAERFQKAFKKSH